MKKLSIIIIIGVCLLFIACEKKSDYDRQTSVEGSQTTEILDNDRIQGGNENEEASFEKSSDEIMHNEDSNSSQTPSTDTSSNQENHILTEQELESFSHMLQQMDYYGFLMSEYDNPKDVNLNELFYSGAGVATESLSKEERAAYLEASKQEEIYLDLVKLTSKEINSSLNDKLGLSLTDMNQTLDWIYLPEYEAYYEEHGDTNYTIFTCTSGKQDGDTYILNCTAGLDYMNDCQVTLKKVGASYHFISNVYIDTNKDAIIDDPMVENAFNNGKIAIQGEWIYFENSYDDGKLYSVKTDGSDIHKINEEWVQWFHVSDDRIYYQNSSGQISVMNIDGSSQHKLNDDKAGDINVAGGKIYYDDGFAIYSMNTDGSDRRKLIEDNALYMNVAGDWIYYSKSGENGIFRIKTDGNDRTKLSDDNPFQMNVSDGWIYYNNQDDGYKLYVMKTDGSNRHKLIDDYAPKMNIVGDRIYYIKGDDWRIFSVKIDGSDRKLLLDDQAEWLAIWGNSMFYTRTGAKIYSMNIDGSDKQMIAELDKDVYKKVTFEANVSLHEGMPEYRFVATGLVTGADTWSMGYVMGLEVYDEDNALILSEDFSEEYRDIKTGYPVYNEMMDTMGLHVTDVNFDGYKDVIILNNFAGAHSNTWYDCWLWDENTGSFVASDSFAKICNPALDPDKKCIYSAGGSGAAYWGGNIYQFIDGEFVVTNELDTNQDGLVEKKLVNGKMEIVREVQYGGDDKIVKDEQEYYKNNELWQLDNPRWYWIGGHQADQWLD